VTASAAGPADEAPAVLTRRHHNVLVLTINRPDSRNAVNQAVSTGIADGLEQLDADPTLAVAVLTGVAGTFCAGMDLRAFQAGERPAVAGRGFAGIVERPPRKPVIAAVEGYAVGGGFEIALACDLIVAARDAKFALPEVRRGLLPGGGGLIRLPAQVSQNLVMEWALTGEMISAETAAAVHVVNRLTGPGEALAAALDLAESIAANAPLALVAIKRIILESRQWPLADAFTRQAEIYEPVRTSSDAREGARAFIEKRTPNWRGV
jgi:enoyl-CoA hydratase